MTLDKPDMFGGMYVCNGIPLFLTSSFTLTNFWRGIFGRSLYEPRAPVVASMIPMA